MNDINTKVCVLMSTYNGEKYLREQIDSVLKQEGVEVKLIVRDDGSTDSTKAILQEYANKGLLTWYAGNNLKPALSFMDLLFSAPDSPYYSFADQDDVWLPTKLKSALAKLQNSDKEPSLYLGSYELVDADLKVINTSPNRYNYTFGESIIRNPAAGCLMVLNKSFVNVIKEYRPDWISMHDVWIYRLCLAIGGRLFLDDKKLMLYRQHGDNVQGGKRSFFPRLYNMFKSYYVTNKHLKYKMLTLLLNNYKGHILPDNLKILEAIECYKKSWSNTIKMAFIKEIRCEEKFINILFKIMVILRIV